MIRELCVEDAPLLRSLRLQALADSPFAFRGTLPEEVDRPLSVWQHLLGARENPFFIVEVGNDVRGIAAVFGPDKDRRAQLWFLWVPPSHRGRGNADELLQHAIDWARHSSATGLSLHVSDGNIPAENLYLRHGFHRTGISLERERDGAIEFEMALDLNASGW